MEFEKGLTSIGYEGDGMSIASILADSPEWEVTSKASYAGEHSITNKLNSGNTSDLTFKIKSPGRCTGSCMAKVDIMGPYEQFNLLLSGKTKKTYTQAPSDREEWTKVMLSTYSPGEHDFTFRVEKGSFFRRTPATKGSG